MHNRAPEYLTEEINLIRDGTTHNLRDSIYNLALQKTRTETLKKSFSYSGSKVWNSLSNKMKSEQSRVISKASMHPHASLEIPLPTLSSPASRTPSCPLFTQAPAPLSLVTELFFSINKGQSHLMIKIHLERKS